MKARVLVSACLLGREVRYDGGANEQDSGILIRWRDENRIVSFCPEVAGGLGVPRPPAETVGGDGYDVWNGEARVVTNGGVDVTEAFCRCAEAALEAARNAGARVAVLKARSPSCGSRRVYDGSFSKTLVDGAGVTAALLQSHGIAVFNEETLEAADRALREIDAAI